METKCPTCEGGTRALDRSGDCYCPTCGGTGTVEYDAEAAFVNEWVTQKPGIPLSYLMFYGSLFIVLFGTAGMYIHPNEILLGYILIFFGTIGVLSSFPMYLTDRGPYREDKESYNKHYGLNTEQGAKYWTERAKIIENWKQKP